MRRRFKVRLLHSRSSVTTTAPSSGATAAIAAVAAGAAVCVLNDFCPYNPITSSSPPRPLSLQGILKVLFAFKIRTLPD